MIGNFLRVPTKKVASLRERPERIKKVLFPDHDDTAMSDDVLLDVDKAWNGIHFLLTGDAAQGALPLGFILCGEPLVDVDVGYGPARAFDADQVRAIAAALEPLTRDELGKRFDPAQLREHSVYPGFRDGWDQPDDRDYLLDHYENLRAFVLETAEAGAGMIVYLN
jgi:hypothetical protein